MHKQKRILYAFAIALLCSATISAITMHLVFGNMPADVVVASPAQERSLDPEPTPNVLLHAAPPQPAAVAPSPRATSTSEVSKDEREMDQWGLRTAYTISVPDLAVRAPVILPSRQYWDRAYWSLLEQQMQAALLRGTVAYPHSSFPGHGPLVIAGHSSPPTQESQGSRFGSVFARLPTIGIGQEIVLTVAGSPYRYSVTDTFIVSSSDTSILDLKEMDDDTLTVITCYPVGTTKERFVVRAKLLQSAS
ncbi:sortase [Candidatus Peribacteria bacterium]|nr:sortase [Candidatus Peribacteria bacterium]